MGKKSLLKSTSKKKNTKTKPDAGKDAVSPQAAESAKETKGKTASKKKPSKSAKAPDAVKEAAPTPEKEKPLTLKELVLKKFESSAQASLYSPPATPKAAFDAPPFVSGYDDAETERIRKLIFKTFDLSSPEFEPVTKAPSAPEPQAAEETAPAPAAAPPVADAPPAVPNAPPVPICELLKKKFEMTAPATLYSPPAAPKADYNAPPFVSGQDDAETGRIRKLLFKTFDLGSPEFAPATEALPAPEPPVAEETTPVPAAAPPVADAPPAVPETPVAAPEASEPVAETVASEALTPPASESETVPPAAEAAVTEATAAAPATLAEPPKPPKRPLPIGMDFPKPPPVPTIDMPEASVTDISADSMTRSFTPKKGLDPMVKKAIGAGIALAAVFIILLLASFQNTTNYYLAAQNGTLEVWQGKWGPMGKERIAVLPGMDIPEKFKPVYSKAEVGTLIVDNYLNRANDLMAAPGIPNIELIRSLLTQALPFAGTAETRRSITAGLNRIDLTALLFKADVSADKATPEGFETAISYLNEAADLATTDAEKQLIDLKVKQIEAKLTPAPPAIEPAAPAPPVEEAPASSQPVSEAPAEAVPAAAH